MLLKDKAARLEADLKGHMQNIKAGIAYNKKKASATIKAVFEAAKIPAPKLKGDTSVAEMFKAAIKQLEKAKAKAAKDADAKDL